jgi:hypothetical protein
MPSYLEIALRVAGPAHPVHPEPGSDGQGPAEVFVADPQTRPDKLSHCGSVRCGGCYVVGEGRKIHPPKCGKAYLDWLNRWQEKGRLVQ